MKICPVEPSCSVQTDIHITRVKVAFRNFANAPKTSLRSVLKGFEWFNLRTSPPEGDEEIQSNVLTRLQTAACSYSLEGRKLNLHPLYSKNCFIRKWINRKSRLTGKMTMVKLALEQAIKGREGAEV
jgi:hypothetical protein